MKLPAELANKKEWTLVGPMGPRLSEIHRSFPIVGVNGGAHFCDEMDLWIGDGDSFAGPIRSKHILTFPSKKAQSDLALAFALFNEAPSVTLHCWGFLGGRRDHELLNFGEALRFLKRKSDSQITFYDAHGRGQIRCLGPGSWGLNHHGLFSLASLETVNVKLQGACEYPLENLTPLPALSSLGLSNSASGKVELTTDGALMIIFPEKL